MILPTITRETILEEFTTNGGGMKAAVEFSSTQGPLIEFLCEELGPDAGSEIAANMGMLYALIRRQINKELEVMAKQ